MSLPKICLDKAFWMIISGVVGLTVLLFNVNEQHLQNVDAELAARQQIVYSVPEIHTQLTNIENKIDKQTQEISDLKAEMKTIKP